VLVAPTFTPFDADGEVNYSVIPDYADHLRRIGIRDVFINGTTGESASLTADEQGRLMNAWVAAAGHDMRVIVHVGHASASEAAALARRAAKEGAHAIAALPPYYFKPTSLPRLVDTMAMIAAAAPELPFYYYHIPSMSGVQMPMARFQQLAIAQIPNFAGIKFTFEDLSDYILCLASAGRHEVYFGRDEMLLGALAVGARSAVGSTYNLFPHIYRAMISCWDAGDIASARQHQLAASRLVSIAIDTGAPLPALKAMMTLTGVDCGSCRLPLARFGTAELADLRDKLRGTDFFLR
jgi:N-acetylneuraminate lyase